MNIASLALTAHVAREALSACPDDPSTFVRRRTPPTVIERGRFPACAVRFSTELTLPDADAPEMQPLGLTEAERPALLDCLYDEPAPNRGIWEDPGHRLLGYPYNLDGSTLVECDFASRNIQDVLWHKARPEQKPKLEREAARRWRLLFQVDSGEATQMAWAGDGLLHYCIEREALAQRDFSRVWLNLQFV